MSFLKAEWRKLVLVNYAVAPEVLLPYLPAGTELDTWNGVHYVSLVGFMFKNTKVLGVKIPLHVDFEEVNLRFYVRRKEGNVWRRGVVFIKEIVPKSAITFVANTLYKEHYVTQPMRHAWLEQAESRLVKYEWKIGAEWQSFGVEAALSSEKLKVGSEAEFITEHYWGYTRYSTTATYEYEVTHPSWEVYPVHDYHIQVDFGKVYGAEFAVLNDTKPTSVMLAEGSSITVEGKRKI